MVVRVVWLHLLLMVLLLGTGCSAPHINAARQSFYRSDFDGALVELQTAEPDKKNMVLLRMERGMVHQARKDYHASIKDWAEAVGIAESLDVYSLSKGTVSLLSNDMAMSFRGAPYERTLIRTFSAKSYLALRMWEDAAVEARNIIHRLENLDGFPDDAYSHYLAGFCLEMIDDVEGAAFQYRLASELLPDLLVDDKTGGIALNRKSDGTVLEPIGTNSSIGASKQSELVCFILMGHAPLAKNIETVVSSCSEPYAELYNGDKFMGRSHTFSDTRSLRALTEKRLMAVQIVKETSRIVIKDTMSDMVSQQNELFGEFLRWFLFALESPDRRCWSTLPCWLQIARVPCSADLKNYRVVFKTHSGGKLLEKTINTPLMHRGNVFVSFCRDI